MTDDSSDNSATGPPATLSKNPLDLHVLWREYEEGLGGHKAAKHFTASKHGRVKAMYHHRKVVWEAVATLVRTGRTAHVAIDMIYRTYGRGQSVTKIIMAMLQDRRERGRHPNLRAGRVVRAV